VEQLIEVLVVADKAVFLPEVTLAQQVLLVL
jgi:hypothetical protein